MRGWINNHRSGQQRRGTCYQAGFFSQFPDGGGSAGFPLVDQSAWQAHQYLAETMPVFTYQINEASPGYRHYVDPVPSANNVIWIDNGSIGSLATMAPKMNPLVLYEIIAGQDTPFFNHQSS
ncbi:hypothetical protein CBM2634_A140022 [Cupriavidus taiwanensis]|uniref:Uncharacterized protein n=1 Tax=Cupriavidus taiwanensis TaxID=164546 RepID=A0A375IVD2_9BURK|nr:hypothetical protein CBM2634_A140022 [Cupriavidus taiwanensis]